MVDSSEKGVREESNSQKKQRRKKENVPKEFS